MASLCCASVVLLMDTFQEHNFSQLGIALFADNVNVGELLAREGLATYDPNDSAPVLSTPDMFT